MMNAMAIRMSKNDKHFPEDFMFRLTVGEKRNWSQNATTSPKRRKT
jgi:hypothetical protein